MMVLQFILLIDNFVKKKIKIWIIVMNVLLFVLKKIEHNKEILDLEQFDIKCPNHLLLYYCEKYKILICEKYPTFIKNMD